MRRGLAFGLHTQRGMQSIIPGNALHGGRNQCGLVTSWRLGLCDVGLLACWLVGLFVFVRLHVGELAPSHVDLLTDWRVGLSASL